MITTFNRLAIGLFCLLIVSCNSEPKIVPVSGTVTIDGQPVEHGTIQISPEGYRTASGKLGTGGKFTLTTFKDGDGAAVGNQHKVAVTAIESIDASKQRWHAPQKYRDFDTSELTCTITGPTNDLKIELTWKGDRHDKPFLEYSGSTRE